MALRKKLFQQNPHCCWCSVLMELQPEKSRNLATLEHHYSRGKIVLSHLRCNKSKFGSPIEVDCRVKGFGSDIFNPLIERVLELLAEKRKRHFFKFELKDSLVRQLDKESYKKTMSWLRKCRRKVEIELKKNNVL